MDKGRLFPTAILFIIIALIFFFALIRIQIFQYDFYKEKAEIQQRRFIKIATDRGDIFSRDGEMLATSLNSYSIYINPRVFRDYERLSKLLGEKVPPADPPLAGRYFLWVKRKLDSETVRRINAEKIPGVGTVVEKKRIYPFGRLAAQVIGFAGVDNEGLAGLELSLDSYLRAEEGWFKTYADPVGYEFLQAKRKKLNPEEEGLNVVLTIDSSIQYAVERELGLAIKNLGASAGTAIILDVQNGEILALASKPDFDPNHYSDFDRKLWNSPVCSVYEPGSTFKVITLASALEEGVIDLNTKLNALDTIVVGGKKISNSHKIAWPGSKISLSYLLEQSINTASVQVAQKLGEEKFYQAIRNFGFGEKTNLELPGESRGILRHYHEWYRPDIAMMSFGQSIAVTPIQLLIAYASLARGGEILKPRLVRRIESRDGSYVKSFAPEVLGRSVSKKTAMEMMNLMKGVVVNGSGRRAAIDHFTVAGKTGTAQKIAPGVSGYLKNHFIASFIGIAPADRPRLCALVVIDDPRASIWGESTAAPVFKRIVTESFRYLNIRPDKL